MQAHITFASRRLEHWLKHRPKPLARERRLLPAKWREDLSRVDCFERRTTLLILLETHLMREAIMGHQWLLILLETHLMREAIMGHQWSSAAVIMDDSELLEMHLPNVGLVEPLAELALLLVLAVTHEDNVPHFGAAEGVLAVRTPVQRG